MRHADVSYTVSGFFPSIETDYSFSVIILQDCFFTQVTRSVAEFREGIPQGMKSRQRIWEELKIEKD